MAPKKRKAKTPLMVQLDEAHRQILVEIKKETGASFGEIIRRMILKAGS
jgi:hypothetical protein